MLIVASFFSSVYSLALSHYYFSMDTIIFFPLLTHQMERKDLLLMYFSAPKPNTFI